LFGLAEEIGTAEVGKRADLALLGGNPLEDLENARDMRKVILGGRVLDPNALLHHGAVPVLASEPPTVKGHA
jgi:imidazolonepropionase-like amidohydrolase